MKRIFIGLAMLSLTACASTGRTVPVPQVSEITERLVPIAVPVEVSVTRPQLQNIDPGDNAPLEQQNAVLRSMLLRSYAYITELETAVKAVGGSVVK